MNLISMLIASAGLSLATLGPDGGECAADCDKGCCTTEAAKESKDGACPLCASHDKGEAMAKKELPEVDSAAYGNAAWPAHNTGETLYAKDFQGKPLPAALGSEDDLSEDIDLEDLEGKVLVLDFWATWCGPCIASAPKLAKLQESHEGNVQVVSISGLREDSDTVKSFIETHDEPFFHLYDEEQTVFKHFESRFIPLVVIVSTDGVVRWIGNPGDQAFEQALNKVVEVDPLIQAKG